MPTMGAVRRIGAVSHAVSRTVGSPTIAAMSAGIRRLLHDRGPMGGSIAAVVLVVAWVSAWRPQVDADAWWHVAYGGVILDGGVIPATERFSWLADGSPVFLHSWLWDVLIGAADRLAGPTGISILGLPFLALIVAMTWLVVGTVAADVAPIPRATLVLVAMLAGLAFWGSRGSTLDVAFVLGTTLVIAKYVYAGATRPMAALPVIGLLWANLHGSGVPAFGVCLIAAFAAIPLARRLGEWPPRSLRPVAVAGAAAIVATVVNPYGLRLWTYPLDRGVASAFATEIVEWRLARSRGTRAVGLPAAPPGRSAPSVGGVARRQRDPFIILLAAAWTFVALAVARFVPIAGALLVVSIAPAAFAVRPVFDEVAARPIDRRSVLIPTVVLSAMVLVIGWSFIAPGAQSAAIAHREPVAALETLRTADCPGRLLASYEWAGYVIRNADREVGAYGNSAEASVVDQTAVELVQVDPRPWLDDHQVEVVLTHSDGPLSRWLDEADDWRPSIRGPAGHHPRSRQQRGLRSGRLDRRGDR